MDFQTAIQSAADRIRLHIRRTPVEPAPTLGPNVWLKCENMQVTGSFKIRGATNALLSLPTEARAAGVVTASSGNHGAGVARAANQLGVDATVFVPTHADNAKVEAIQRNGANVERVGDDCVQTEAHARSVGASQGKTYISPYNDIQIICGQGTIGHEIYQQIPELDAVFIAVGGGGLISGVGSYLKAMNPDIEIVACSPAASPAIHECLDAEQIIDVECHDTLSDATAGGVEPGSITFELCQQVIDRSLLVSESDIATAVRDIISTHHMLIEGAAGVAVAGYQQVAEEFKNKNVAIILCGANIGIEKLEKVLIGGNDHL
ncbi:MAG: serine/threonine dehydratase [Deltaproteobacteria bacterium]|nr:serine/threonine dehydratase [Deltaproteobacteria bacterium]